jgi:HK97 family phage major capsid protein
MGNNELKTIRKTDDELVVANYMVLFGGNDHDGQHFTKSTDFESSYTKTGTLYIDWDHGEAKELYGDDVDSPGRHDILGWVDWKTAKTDDTGLWVERVLDVRNRYIQYTEPLIEAGLIGSSSEAVPNLIEVSEEGEIKRWGLRRDAFTVLPAEPRMMKEFGDNVITAIKALSEFQPHLKALLQDGETVDDGATSEEGNQDEKSNTLENNGGKKKMSKFTPEELAQIKVFLEKDETPPAPPEKLEDPVIKALSEQMNALTEMIANSPKLKDAGYVAPDSEEDHSETKSFGDFVVAVRNKNIKRLKSVYKAALAEGAGATGGYLVPTEFGDLILNQVRDFNALRRAGPTVVNMTSRSREVPVFDIETAPSAGDTAYAGGAIAYWTAEAGSITETEPRFRMLELIAHKIAGLSLASSEVREDASESVDSLIAQSFARAVGSKEQYAFFRGDGVGKPVGIMSSGALISATRSAASTVALADLAQMMSDFTPESWGTGAWFINPTVIDQIIQLVSAPLSWLTDMRSGLQSTLLGLPLYVVGCLPALNTVGDILLIDPKYYYVGDRRGLTIGFSEHYKFANDQLAWRVTKRVDGQPMIDNAITLEDGATTVSPFVALAAG